MAKREFLQANVVVKSRKVFLPKLLESYSREALISFSDLLRWAMESVVVYSGVPYKLIMSTKYAKKVSLTIITCSRSMII